MPFTDLKQFKCDRVLNEDPLTHTLTILGTFPPQNSTETERSPAILRIEHTALSTDVLKDGMLSDLKSIESTDIYSWLFGWFEGSIAIDERSPNVKINIICPATETHINKYTAQQIFMVHETPELYERVVRPYIASFPKPRTQWVEDIFSGHSEQSKILFSSPEFIILPDMKWDLVTLSSLYLLAIARDQPLPPNSSNGESKFRRVHSMRDLRREDVRWLKSIRLEAGRIVKERWGLDEKRVRCYIHYQPSYYHFHVHIVNANYTGLMGMTVGQAWLLDDVISLLELDPPTSDIENHHPSGSSIMQRMTFTYGLGEQHGLFEGMRAAQATLNADSQDKSNNMP